MILVMNNQTQLWHDHSIEVVSDGERWKVYFGSPRKVATVTPYGSESKPGPKTGMVLVIHNGTQLAAKLIDAPEPRAGLAPQEYEAKAIEAVEAELAAHA
jgi:hypothetical protein